MQFCEKCGNLMELKKEKGEAYWYCNSCKLKVKAKDFILEWKVRKEPKVLKPATRIVLPKTKAICPKCGHHEAYWEERQTRASDEPPTTLYTCVKCGHRWREY